MLPTVVPLVDLRAQYEQIRPEIDRAIASVLATAQFVGGPECAAFEEEFAAFCGVSHACGVANGTDALELVLRAMGVGVGDEVITVSATFVATGEAIVLAGARPVFVDVDRVGFTMDPGRLEEAITARTKVILPVHLYGHPADMPAILDVAARHGIPVLEDAAQAHGASLGTRRVGSIGHAAAFSFYPGKNLGAYGDAGAVVSNDRALIDRVRQLANHGAGAGRYDNVVSGTNSRLDALQAAVLRVKLSRLPGWNDQRRRLAAMYGRALDGLVEIPRERGGARSAWHLYAIRAKDRCAVAEALREAGISTGIHYPTPLHLQAAMAPHGRAAGDLSVTEGLFREVLSLPLYPEMPDGVIARVADVLRRKAAIAPRAAVEREPVDAHSR